jgi:hypothetical protein
MFVVRSHMSYRLSLGQCSVLTDESLLLVARHCRGLTSLDVSYCPLLTDLAIGRIIDSCHQLHKYVLSHFSVCSFSVILAPL